MEDNMNNTPRPGFFSAIIDSIKNPHSFKGLRRVKLLSAIGFLALFLFLYQGIVSLHFSMMTAVSLDKLAEFYRENLPEIRINKGKVEADVPMPYVKHNQEEDIVFIIDTTGQIKDLRDYPQGILLRESEMVLKQSRYDTRTHDLSKVEKFTINPETITRWKGAAFSIVFPVALLLGFFWQTLAMCLIVPLMGFVSLQFGKNKGCSFPFSQHGVIAIYSLTLPFLVNLLLKVTGLSARIPGILSGLVFWGLLIFLVHRNTMGALAGESLSGDVPGEDLSCRAKLPIEPAPGMPVDTFEDPDRRDR